MRPRQPVTFNLKYAALDVRSPVDLANHVKVWWVFLEIHFEFESGIHMSARHVFRFVATNPVLPIKQWMLFAVVVVLFEIPKSFQRRRLSGWFFRQCSAYRRKSDSRSREREC